MIDNFEKYLQYLDEEKVKNELLNKIYVNKPQQGSFYEEINIILIDEVIYEHDSIKISGTEFSFWFVNNKYQLVATSNDAIYLNTKEKFNRVFNTSDFFKKYTNLYYAIGEIMESRLKDDNIEFYREEYKDLLNFINTIPNYKKMKNIKKFNI